MVMLDVYCVLCNAKVSVVRQGTRDRIRKGVGISWVVFFFSVFGIQIP